MRKLILIVLAAAATVSCGLTQEQADTAVDVVKDIDSLAQRGCEIFYADTFGISLEDAAKAYCTSKHVKEFRDRFLSASHDAGLAIGAAPPPK